jgi:translation elongation factor EF-Tu-like GTPase
LRYIEYETDKRHYLILLPRYSDYVKNIITGVFKWRSILVVSQGECNRLYTHFMTEEYTIVIVVPKSLTKLKTC